MVQLGSLGQTPSTAELSASYERAARALGRLEGMLALAPPLTVALFAQRLVDEVVVHALRSEQHTFTGAGYAQWRAGLGTLSLEVPTGAISPRLLAHSVLAALSDSLFAPIADAARKAQLILRAIPDAASEDDRAETQATVAAGLALASSVSARQPTDLMRLADAAANDPRFSPRERELSRLGLGAVTKVVERRAEPSPLWAINLAFGAALSEDFGVLRHLPFPGALPLAALRADLDLDERREALASAVEGSACVQAKLLSETASQLRTLSERLPKLRSTSRTPDLAALLLAAGPLSSHQIERVLAASRLGVRDMLGKLDDARVLSKVRSNGTYLYSILLDVSGSAGANVRTAPLPFSKSALDEFDAAMAAADAVLTRSRWGPSDIGDLAD